MTEWLKVVALRATGRLVRAGSIPAPCRIPTPCSFVHSERLHGMGLRFEQHPLKGIGGFYTLRNREGHSGLHGRFGIGGGGNRLHLKV